MLLSIIVPVYNVEHYIVDCLNSIYENFSIDISKFEIILVNDGSTDGSERLVLPFVDRFPNIRYYIKDNGGLSDARNYGLKQSKGSHIAFLDSDDVISPRYLSSVFEVINAINPDIISFGYNKFFNDLVPDFYENHFLKVNGEEKPLIFYATEPVFAWNKVYKRSLFDFVMFPIGRYYEDVWTTPILLSNAKSFYHIDKELYGYRQRKGSITFKQDNSYMDILDALHHLKSVSSPFVDNIIVSQLFTLALISLRMKLPIYIENFSKVSLNFSNDFYDLNADKVSLLKRFLYKLVVNFPRLSIFFLLIIKPFINLHYSFKTKKIY